MVFLARFRLPPNAELSRSGRRLGANEAKQQRSSQDGRKQQLLLEVSLFEENQAAEMAEARDDTGQRGDHAQLDQQGYED